MEIHFSTHFLRQAKKLSPELRKKLSGRIEIFRKDPHDSRLRLHNLTGRLKKYHSFSLTYSIRVLLLFPKSNVALFVDIGSHDAVYR
ncbi:MAG: type II toxin-antitoxin system mRNA interferase toxin, RelE/StbE family [Patescibacteria group bacterium]